MFSCIQNDEMVDSKISNCAEKHMYSPWIVLSFGDFWLTNPVIWINMDCPDLWNS